MTNLERIARAICRERGGPACDCRADGVPCRAPLANLLDNTNPLGHQARAVLAALSPRLRAYDRLTEWCDSLLKHANGGPTSEAPWVILQEYVDKVKSL